jgi:hypothetical protein
MITIINSGRIILARHVARMEEKSNVDGVSVRKPESNRPLGRPRRRLEDDFKMNFREIGWGGMVSGLG